MLVAFVKIYKLFRKLKPDVANTNLFDDSFIGLLAARLAGVKIRVILKQDTAFHWFYKPSYVWADRFNNNNATHIVAPCNETRKFIIEKEKANPEKVHIIHSGIDLNDITNKSEDYKKLLIEKYGLKDKFVVCTIARLIEWKGYRYVIEAVRILTESNKNLRFLFVGEGEQKAELMDLADKYRLSNYIVFTGWIERKYIPSLYGAMDLYVHAAVMEPFGFVFCEAMANGVPLVTTKTGAAADILTHKETCYFAEDKNPKSLADGIKWMIENPVKRVEMKEKVKELAEKYFSVDRMLDDYINLYKQNSKN